MNEIRRSRAVIAALFIWVMTVVGISTAAQAHACEPWNCSNFSPNPGPSGVVWNYGWYYQPGWYNGCWWNGGNWYGNWC